jgi:hypothetical protein
MRTVALIARDELRRAVRSRWTAVSIAGIWLTTLTATWVGHRAFVDGQASHLAALQAKVEDQLRAKQPDGRNVDPGLRVLRPSPVGLVLVEGAERQSPSAWDFGPAGPVSLPRNDNLRSQLGGLSSWDLGYVVTVIGSLAALAAAFASIWAHRTSGWVSVAAMRRTSQVWQAIGQLAGGQLVVAAAVATWVTAALASLALMRISGLADEVLRMTPVVWLLLSTFYSLGSAIASMVESPARAWPIGLLLWSFAAAAGSALPTLATYVLFPVTSADVWYRERADRFLEHAGEHETVFVNRLTAGLPTISPRMDRDDAVAMLFARMDGEWQDHVREIRQSINRLDEERAERIRRQRRIRSWFTAMVPAAAAHAVMAELAGTGRSRLELWEEAIRHHHVKLSLALFDNRPVVNMRVPFGNGAQQHGFVRRRPGPQYADLPAFEPPNDGDSAWQVSASQIANLGIWWLSVSALAVIARVRLARVSGGPQRS